MVDAFVDKRHKYQFNPINLRFRLVRKVFYRTWNYLAVSKAKKLIRNIQYETLESKSIFTPLIILSSFSRVEDLFILSYLFREKELTFFAPKTLPSDKVIDRLLTSNFVDWFDSQNIGFRFFRRILSVLKDFNRSIVIAPDAAKYFEQNFSINPGVVVKLAIKASVPILPVVIDWKINGSKSNKQCDVYIGKKLYISPRASEFRDIFFKRRGVRKFEKLTREEFSEIGERIFSKLKGQNKDTKNGTNI